MVTIPAYLLSIDLCERKDHRCMGECREPVKQAQSNRWYITMGHPGFNSMANNWRGYATKGRALAALRHYAGKGSTQ